MNGAARKKTPTQRKPATILPWRADIDRLTKKVAFDFEGFHQEPLFFLSGGFAGHIIAPFSFFLRKKN
jgi:hypothetical protein